MKGTRLSVDRWKFAYSSFYHIQLEDKEENYQGDCMVDFDSRPAYDRFGGRKRFVPTEVEEDENFRSYSFPHKLQRNKQR